MAVKLQELDWENALGAPPVEPVPQLSDITRQHFEKKRSLFRNLVMMIIALSGIYASVSLVKQGFDNASENHPAPVVRTQNSGVDLE